MAKRHELTDAAWAVLAPLLPARRRRYTLVLLARVPVCSAR
jgi:transposase